MSEDEIEEGEELPPHVLEEDELIEKYNTSDAGLSKPEAADLLSRLGSNELRQAESRSPLDIFLDQFKDFLIWILIGAALVSGYLGELGDCIAIVTIVIVNGAIGFIQELRAEKAMAALCQMSPPKAHVIRGGQDIVIPAAELVPGDMIVLEAGGVVPADIRIIESANLKINEAALTGESLPVEKQESPLDDADIPLGDRSNIAFMGTVITYGRGKGVIFATGMKTELGRIAEMLESRGPEQTPLQRRLEKLGKRLGSFALLICVLLFGLGLYQAEVVNQEKLLELFMTAVSLAVAAIPEALPAVVTISLALGAARMVKLNSLVRKLPAVETLGSVTVICSDKTGTLTQNRMLVRQIWVDGKLYDVTGKGYEPKGKISTQDGEEVEPKVSGPKGLEQLLLCMGLCNDSKLIPPMGEIPSWDITGDPTEGGLTALAAKAGYHSKELSKSHPRKGELPFSSDRKMMTTLHVEQGVDDCFSYTKGGLDVMLPKCSQVLSGGDVTDFTKEKREEVIAASEAMAAKGLRVLVAAKKSFGGKEPEVSYDTLEQGMVFIGFVGIQDPPRESVSESIETCRLAGIHTVMITGDHPLTASAIAKEIGMVDREVPEVITGRELSKMSVEVLQERLGEIQVFARVSPEHKLKNIEAWKRKGEIVSMTGDGVNDAPALKEADIGVAMGIQGTDVSKEAADMILLDDNFSTIVHAVREGRRIFENIRKFVRFVVIGNTGEIWTMFLAPIVGLPIPLLPIQILWVNLVTDGLPGLALAVEPAEGDVMKRPPRPPQEAVLTGRMGFSIFLFGLYVGILCVSTFYYMHEVVGAAEGRVRAFTFTLLCVLQLFLSLAVKSERDQSIGTLSKSPYLLGAFFFCALLQLVVVSFPMVSQFFHISPLSWVDLLKITLLGSSIFFLAELEKWVNRRRSARV